MPYCFCTTSWLLCHVFPIIELTLFSPVISFFKKKFNDKNYTNFFLTSPLYATQIDNIIFLLNYWLIVLSSSIISMISFTLILRNFSRLAYYFSLDIYIYIYIYIYIVIFIHVEMNSKERTFSPGNFFKNLEFHSIETCDL
jgi:hypothetical protein